MEAATTDKVDLRPYNELTIFLYNGETLMFYSIILKASDERAMCFDYVSKATGLLKHASFFKERIAGYSVSDERVEENG